MGTSDFLVEILRYDKKTTSYKMALLRAINDFIFDKHDYIDAQKDNIAIALDDLARLWVAYYWPFVNRDRPIFQGIQTTRNGVVAQDISFRFALTNLKEKASGISADLSLASGGYKLLSEAFTGPEIFPSFEQALKEIQKALLMPIRYVGQGEWAIFSKPQWLSDLPLRTQVIHPFPRPNQKFIVISSSLWKAFYELSYLLEAICIHECFCQSKNRPL